MRALVELAMRSPSVFTPEICDDIYEMTVYPESMLSRLATTEPLCGDRLSRKTLIYLKACRGDATAR